MMLNGYTKEEFENLKRTPFIYLGEATENSEQREQLETYTGQPVLEILYSFEDGGLFYYEFNHSATRIRLDSSCSDLYFCYDISNLNREPGKLIDAHDNRSGQSVGINEQQVQAIWLSILARHHLKHQQISFKVNQKVAHSIKKRLYDQMGQTPLKAFAFNSKGDLQMFRDMPHPAQYQLINNLPTFFYCFELSKEGKMEVRLVKEIVPPRSSAPKYGKSVSINGQQMNENYYYNHIKTLNGKAFDRDVAKRIIANFNQLGFRRGENIQTPTSGLVTLVKNTRYKAIVIRIGFEVHNGKQIFNIIKFTQSN